MGSVGAGTNQQNAKLDEEMREAIDYYTMDGYYINNIMRKGLELDKNEQHYVDLLDRATNDDVKYDQLYRIVDPKVVFGRMTETQKDHLRAHLLIGEGYYDRGPYMQGIKAQMNDFIGNFNKNGRELTDNGFMSTTSNWDEAVHKQYDQTHSDHGGVILNITNAKELKGRDIGGDEHEVLLKRGYTYQFQRVYAKNGVIMVDTKVVKK